MYRVLQAPQKLLSIIAILIAVIAYFGLNHGDLIVTGIVSDAILGGNFFNLYDYILHFLPTELVAYLPSTYVTFAIWNFPLKLLNSNIPYYFSGHEIQFEVGNGIYWSKLLPVSLFFLTAVIVHDILELLAVDKRLSFIATIFWITSPLSFYSQFIFGQYDIFYIFFTLLAIDLYLRNKYVLGSLMFGVAFTFKYFPVMVFLPVLFYTFRKKPIDIFKYGFIALLPVAVEFGLFINSAGFRLAMLNNPASLGGIGRLFNDGISNGAAQGGYTVILFILLCMTAYILLPENSPKTLIYLAVAATTIFSIFVLWNPQWIIFSSSFLALLPFMFRNLDKQKLKNYIIIDLLIMFCFIGYVACQWPWDVDINMFNAVPWLRGVSYTDPRSSINIAFFFLMGNRIDQELGKNIYYSGFIAAWIFAVAYSILNAREDGRTKPEGGEATDLDLHDNAYRLVLIRFILGASIFLIPALLALFFGQPIYHFLYSR